MWRETVCSDVTLFTDSVKIEERTKLMRPFSSCQEIQNEIFSHDVSEYYAPQFIYSKSRSARLLLRRKIKVMTHSMHIQERRYPRQTHSQRSQGWWRMIIRLSGQPNSLPSDTWPGAAPVSPPEDHYLPTRDWPLPTSIIGESYHKYNFCRVYVLSRQKYFSRQT